MTMATAALAVSKLPFCIEIIDKILDLIDFAKENDEHCRHMLGQIEVIRSILVDLQKIPLSEAVQKSIDFVCVKLANCDQCMDDIMDQDFCFPRQVLLARKYRRNLRRIKSEIDSAITTLNTAQASQILLQHAGIGPTRETKCAARIPGRPEDLEVTKRAHNRIKLCWNAPNENAEYVSQYEVHYRRRWKKWVEPICTKNTHLVVCELTADTKYWFRVRAVSGESYKGRFSSDIATETKFSKLARGLITTGAAIGGTFAAPVMAGIGSAFVVSKCESSEEKTAMAALGATSVVAATLMPPLGTIATALTTHIILAPDDFSDDSDED